MPLSIPDFYRFSFPTTIALPSHKRDGSDIPSVPNPRVYWLRARAHSLAVAPTGVELGHLSFHGVDGCGAVEQIYQRGCMAQQYCGLGAGVVRYLCVSSVHIFFHECSYLVATRIDLASGLGLTASSLCISRRLYNIAACQTVSVSKEDVRFLPASFHGLLTML